MRGHFCHSWFLASVWVTGGEGEEEGEHSRGQRYRPDPRVAGFPQIVRRLLRSTLLAPEPSPDRFTKFSCFQLKIFILFFSYVDAKLMTNFCFHFENVENLFICDDETLACLRAMEEYFSRLLGNLCVTHLSHLLCTGQCYAEDGCIDSPGGRLKFPKCKWL